MELNMLVMLSKGVFCIVISTKYQRKEKHEWPILFRNDCLSDWRGRGKKWAC